MTKMEFRDFDRQLREAQLTVELLNRHVGQVKFNPNKPADIERAIIEMEGMVDERLGKHRSNEIIDRFIAETKKAYREQILKLAATALQSAGSDRIQQLSKLTKSRVTRRSKWADATPARSPPTRAQNSKVVRERSVKQEHYHV